MSRKRKPIPSFKSEAEERAFWETHDSTEYMDWSRAERVRLPRTHLINRKDITFAQDRRAMERLSGIYEIASSLKPSTKAISLRLPLYLLERIKVAANKRDVPYQSLIKVWLSEKLDAD